MSPFICHHIYIYRYLSLSSIICPSYLSNELTVFVWYMEPRKILGRQTSKLWQLNGKTNQKKHKEPGQNI